MYILSLNFHVEPRNGRNNLVVVCRALHDPEISMWETDHVWQHANVSPPIIS